MPDSNESVQALNNRARADLILDGTVNARREVELHDGTRAAVGDTVITRRKDRRPRAGRSWVRNPRQRRTLGWQFSTPGGAVSE